MADSNLRQRRAAPASGGSSTKAADAPPTQSRSTITVLDIIRVLLGLVIASSVGSYLVTSRKSLLWGYPRPWWTHPDRLERWWQGPLLLTNEQLAAYDGSDPSKPILLALNRTIYDVSKSPGVYGVGGAYSQLAAKDASRSYITTCFDPKDDLVPYFGGVEEIYVPLWLSKNPGQDELDQIGEGEIIGGMGVEQLMQQVKNKIGRRKINQLQKEAYEEAKERVRAQVKVWEGMFARKDYPVVGKVIGVDETSPRKYANLKFCEAAMKQRPSLADSMSKVLESLGHAGGKLDLGKMKSSTNNLAKNMGAVGKDQVEKQKKAQAKRDDEGKDGGQAKDEAAAEVDQKRQVEEAAHQAVDGDANADDKAKASIEDMMKGGKYDPEEENKKARSDAKKAAKEAAKARKE